jgi:hypothetical protein
MEYDHLSFEGFDDATASNLDTLAHHARQAPQQDAESVQLLIESIVGIHRMLPQPIRSMISVHECHVGDRHMRMKPEQLVRLWEAITAELRDGLDRVIESRAELLADERGLADRRTTQGEKILATLDEFGTNEWSAEFARRLEHEGLGSGVAGEARRLQKLFGKKNIPDFDAHKREIHRTLDRIKRIADGLHGRPGGYGI